MGTARTLYIFHPKLPVLGGASSSYWPCVVGKNEEHWTRGQGKSVVTYVHTVFNVGAVLMKCSMNVCHSKIALFRAA